MCNPDALIVIIIYQCPSRPGNSILIITMMVSAMKGWLQVQWADMEVVTESLGVNSWYSIACYPRLPLTPVSLYRSHNSLAFLSILTCIPWDIILYLPVLTLWLSTPIDIHGSYRGLSVQCVSLRAWVVNSLRVQVTSVVPVTTMVQWILILRGQG